MEKMVQWINIMMDDINKEESAILSSFESILQGLFKSILFMGIPLLLYLVLSLDTLN